MLDTATSENSNLVVEAQGAVCPVCVVRMDDASLVEGAVVVGSVEGTY